MSKTWLLLRSGRGDYALNMALDEALLEAMPRLGRPVLRFYNWTERAASFGYFQKYMQVERMTSLRPLVRRPTAGGLVPHDADWTYSLTYPTHHEWYSLHAAESYRSVHEWMVAAFNKLGIAAELAAHARKVEAGQCFAGWEQFDLLWAGRKIAGAAQRRRRDGLLIQGSVQTQPRTVSQADWQQAMCEVAGEMRQVTWLDFRLDGPLRHRALQLAEQKYSQTHYNQKR